MKEIGEKTAGVQSVINCVEVLISERYASKIYDHLIRTLSVYSLENRAVRNTRAAFASEVFHFMVYDWNRTIKQLLEDQQIPYSIVGFFTLENICHSGDDTTRMPGIDLTISNTQSSIAKLTSAAV